MPRLPRAPLPESLDQYLDDIRAYPLITREDERSLAPRIRAGDREALDRLVRANLRFVVSIAQRYQHRGVALSDLIAEGNLGLIRAAHKFDETLGNRFISYAVWWVRQAILRALAEQGPLVRVPLHRAGLLHRLDTHARALGQVLGRPPTPAEVADGTAFTEAEIVEAQLQSPTFVSLDAPIAPDADGRLLDLLPDTASLTPHEATCAQALADGIHGALRCLPEREAMVLRLYYGLEGVEPLTLAAIGGLLHVTRERVRQIKDQALERLRHLRRGQSLASHLDS